MKASQVGYSNLDKGVPMNILAPEGSIRVAEKEYDFGDRFVAYKVVGHTKDRCVIIIIKENEGYFSPSERSLWGKNHYTTQNGKVLQGEKMEIGEFLSLKPGYDNIPHSPEIQLNPLILDNSKPQAWLRDGTWFYNRLGMRAEVAHEPK